MGKIWQKIVSHIEIRLYRYIVADKDNLNWKSLLNIIGFLVWLILKEYDG